MSTPVSDIGLIGLAVMGENLALNIESKGTHTDKPCGEFFHANWTGRGGSTTSQTYSV